MSGGDCGNAKMGGGLPLVLVQGGATYGEDCPTSALLEGVKRAALRGLAVLTKSKCVLQAAEAACILLENDPAFNAGRGSLLNSAGGVEMGACLMDGSTLRSGSVALVNCVMNPISLARKVMMHSDCAIIASAGARNFAEGLGMETVTEDQLRTQTTVEAFEEFRRNIDSWRIQEAVGVVVVDCKGRVATASSSGGGRTPGRIAASSLPGCGSYCDNAVGGVACSGPAESIIQYNLAQRILSDMRNGKSAEEATVEGLCGVGRTYGRPAGAVAVSRQGEVGIGFTSDMMPWACLHSNQLHSGILPGQHCIEAVSIGS